MDRLTGANVARQACTGTDRGSGCGSAALLWYRGTMPRRRLTASSIAGLRHTGGGTATMYWHTGSPGLALAVTAGGRRTWRFRERKRNPRTFVIGRWPEMSLAAACRKADELRNQGTATDFATATVDQAVARYLVEHRLKKGRIAHECRNQRSACAWISDKFGGVRLRTLDSDTIADAFVELRDRPAVHDWTRAVLVALFRFSGMRDHPVRVKRIVQPYQKRGLETREIAAILHHVYSYGGPVTRTLLLCAFELAARPGELARTRWADVDLRRRTLVIRNSKNGKDLHYDLSDRVVGMLEDMQTLSNQCSDYVFPSGRNSHLKNYRTAWATILRRAGVVGRTRPYDLIRHGRATMWLQAGVSLADVSALLHHSDVGMTSRYLDSTRDRRRAAIDLPPPSMADDMPRDTTS